MRLAHILRQMDIKEIFSKSLKYLTNPAYRFKTHAILGWHDNVSDEEYLRQFFLGKMGYMLNLDNPQTFCEKQQWLKLHDRRPEYTMMVDKYAVKSWVANTIGEQYVIPTLGVWNHFDEIDFSVLPEQFVLKCTQDSGSVTICKDKRTFNFKAAKKKLNAALKCNAYYYAREWPYKDVPHRIIGETFLVDTLDTKSRGLIDYKFYCFHGEPKFLYVSEGLGGNHRLAKMIFVDLDWKKTPFQREDFLSFDKLPPKPYGFSKMVEIARILSENIPFVRVDLYSVNCRIYFSEMTFSPGSGMAPFFPPEWERRIGEWIHLPI